VGVHSSRAALDELPPDILYATTQIVISTPVGDFGGAIVEVERGSRSFHIVCVAPGGYRLSDLRKRFWNLYYYMRNPSDSRRPAIALPTLRVFIYASSGEWLYIASTHFSAADLIISAAGAVWNPFAFLDGSVVAVVNRVKFQVVNASEVLGRLYIEIAKMPNLHSEQSVHKSLSAALNLITSPQRQTYSHGAEHVRGICPIL